MGMHRQNLVSGLGRNQLSFHPSSLNSLQPPNPLVSASMPCIIVYPMDNYYCPCFTCEKIGLVSLKKCPGPQITRVVEWGQEPRSARAGPYHSLSLGSAQRKQTLRVSSPCKLLPKLQEKKELDEGRSQNMRSWELKVEREFLKTNRWHKRLFWSLCGDSSVTQDITTAGWSPRFHHHSWLQEQPSFSEG